MMPEPRRVKALARKVVCTKRVTRWQIYMKGRLIGSAPAKTVGHTKADAIAWAQRQFPHLHNLEIRGVC